MTAEGAGQPNSPEQSQAALALMGVAVSVLLGTGFIALALVGVRALAESAAPVVPTPDPPTATLASPAGVLLFVGSLSGLALAAGAALIALAPIKSWYRRGALAMVSAFATLVVSLISVPIHHFGGRLSLLALAAACVLGVVTLSPRLARLRRAAT